MRAVFVLALPLILLAGCAKSPQEQQSSQIRDAARDQAQAITERAEAQAGPLDQQAEGLRNQAKQVGGYAGKRLNVQADSLKKQADLLREQADRQGDAVKEAADARVKQMESR